MSTTQDFDITIVPITTISRPMQPIPSDCVMKLCRPCGVSLVIKKASDACPFCKTSFQEKE